MTDKEIAELGKQLAYDRPDEARVDNVRAVLLAAAKADVPERSRWLLVGGAFATGALAAAAAVMLVMRPHHAAPTIDDVASITASSAADFQREITRTTSGVDEIVRLHGGRVTLAVGTLATGERVRVASGDAEVEGQGHFDVAVASDELREVAVTDGSATVRVHGHQAIFLAAGETWKPSTVTADVTPLTTATPSAVVTPTVTAAPRIADTHVTTPRAHTDAPADSPVATQRTDAPADTRIATTHSDARANTRVATTQTSRIGDVATPPAVVEPALVPTTVTPPPDAPPPVAVVAAPKPGDRELERHFEAGWQLLKAGRDAEAARELGAAADATGNDPLAADARYFQAIALTKSGRKTEAEAALVAYLDRAPHAVRRGRAAVMLGRLIAERGDVATARNWFESALHDGDPAVAAAARDALR